MTAAFRYARSLSPYRGLSRGVLPDHQDLALGLQLRVSDGVVVKLPEEKRLFHRAELFPGEYPWEITSSRTAYARKGIRGYYPRTPIDRQ